MGKQLINFITCGYESSAPFLLFTKSGVNPHQAVKFTIKIRRIETKGVFNV
jgi:hypothetical protein